MSQASNSGAAAAGSAGAEPGPAHLQPGEREAALERQVRGLEVQLDRQRANCLKLADMLVQLAEETGREYDKNIIMELTNRVEVKQEVKDEGVEYVESPVKLEPVEIRQTRSRRKSCRDKDEGDEDYKYKGRVLSLPRRHSLRLANKNKGGK